MGLTDFIGLYRNNRQKFKNFIFQGGSVKGLAYVGALDVLEKSGIKISGVKRMGGTSVGSITATLLSVGYDVNELNEDLKSLDFTQFLDIEDNELRQLVFRYINNEKTLLAMLNDKFEEKKPTLYACKKELENMGKLGILWHRFSAIRQVLGDFILKLLPPLKKVMDEKGIAEGDEFRKWMEEKISIKTGIKFTTFAELNELHEKDPKKYKQLYLIGGNATEKKCEVFSHEQTPDLIISDAVRISMSIPVLFKPHQKYIKLNEKRVLEKTSRKHFYIDGGVFDNYPIWLFDDKKYYGKHEKSGRYNTETLGFRLEPFMKTLTKQIDKGGGVLDIYKKSEEETNNENWKFLNLDYFLSIALCFYNKQDSDFDLTLENEKKRTIFIDDNDISTLKFNLNLKEKAQLIKSGGDDARKFLNYYKQIQADEASKANSIYNIYKLVAPFIILPLMIGEYILLNK